MGSKRAIKNKRKQRPIRTPAERLEYFKEKSKAMEVEAAAKPKSHKVKKLLKKKEDILQNDPKHSLFIRGNNCSQVVKSTMLELHRMRDLFISKCLLQKKNNIQPFEDASYIEHVAEKNDAGFVIFGSHNKKRPNNMIIHRMYNQSVLDMIELGVIDVKTMQDFKVKIGIEIGMQPILLFQGDAFDLSENHIKFKNMMLDFFRIKHLQNLNILSAQRIITFTSKAVDGEILMQQFEAGTINEGLAGDGKVDMKEIGPKVRMEIRRVKHADFDAWKAATRVKKSKAKMVEKKRNISTNELGQRVGKAYIQHQDFSTLALKKPKRKKLVEGDQDGEENPTGQETGGDSGNEE